MTTGSGARRLVDGGGEERVATVYGIYDGVGPRTRVDFRPAGGAPGLDRPDGSGGRRGSVGKSLGLAGGGVSKSIRPDVEEAAAGATRAMATMGGRDHRSGVRFGDEGSSSVGGGEGYDSGGVGGKCAGSPDVLFGGGGAEVQPAKLSRRRQSNTGQLRELVEAWPEAATAATMDDRRSSSDNGCGDVNRDDTPEGLERGVAELRRDDVADCDGDCPCAW